MVTPFDRRTDTGRGRRTGFAVFVLCAVGLLGLVQTALLLYVRAALDWELSARSERVILFQLLADVPFAVGAVLAVASLRVRVADRSARFLLWALLMLGAGVGVLILGAITEGNP